MRSRSVVQEVFHYEPNADSLHADLTSVGQKYTSDGRLQLEKQGGHEQA